jgi:thymidylate synthase (FAD)
MKQVKPQVFLISRPAIDWVNMGAYLDAVGEETGAWMDRMSCVDSDAEVLVEFAGRECYRSWAPGLNANVTQVREDSGEFLTNVKKQGHGSLMEHANLTFVLRHVSRVLTHELVRHRAGCAYSQESLRYVRLDDLPMWIPDWALEDKELMIQISDWLNHTEALQMWMALHFHLDTRPFSLKKKFTSFMRRFAPMGVATDIVMTMNIRTLRHVIYMRTALAAEEEIRMVFDEVARICLEEFPNLMADFDPNEDKEWIPQWLKI